MEVPPSPLRKPSPKTICPMRERHRQQSRCLAYDLRTYLVPAISLHTAPDVADPSYRPISFVTQHAPQTHSTLLQAPSVATNTAPPTACVAKGPCLERVLENPMKVQLARERSAEMFTNVGSSKVNKGPVCRVTSDE